MTRRLGAAALAGMLLAAASAPGRQPPGARGGEPVVVASKNFSESRLLAEVAAQLLEARAGLAVERRFGLAGTQVCFEALVSGAVDLYPEYTGTGLVSILDQEAGGGRREALVRVRREFLRRWDLHWLAPLGFENAYEIAVPRDLAERHGLATISDLAAIAPRLEAGFGYEFVERPDGLPGLEEVYDLRFAGVRRLQQTLKYRAAGRGEIDALDVYTTDGRLLTYDLVLLEDDLGFFPPYEAAYLVNGTALDRRPEIAATLGLLAGSLDEAAMRRWNLRLEEGGEPERRVAAELLAELGLVATTAAGGGGDRRDEGLLAYLWSQRGALAARTLEHLGMTAVALALGVLVAVPAGLGLERRRRVAEPFIRAVGSAQTVPSIALLAFMIPLFGVGWLPAVVALWIYSLFPILRNTYSGVRDADPAAVEAATALGMTGRQILLEIRMPLAAPTVMAGVRTAAVLTVGTATLAAFIGAGGLGEPIVTGLQLADVRIILSGALPAAALALVVDHGLGALERRLRPRGVVEPDAGV